MRRTRHQTLHSRAEQAGLLSAAAGAPLAYQRTLMARSTVDQALVSGLAFASNHALATTIQEGLQSLALIAVGEAARAAVDEPRWSRAALASDVGALAAGLVLQRAFSARSREPLERAAARSTGYWLARSATAGLVIGALQHGLGRVNGPRAKTALPVVVPAVGAFVSLAEWRRRRDAHRDQELSETAQASRLKASAMGLAVSAGATGVGVGERLLADIVSSALARVLPGNAALWRPVGHVASLALLGAATDAMLRETFRRIEHAEESVEPAFDIPPPLPDLSGSLASAIPFETLARAGRRFVWTVTIADRLEEVMGEPARRAPARLYVGLESAESETARVALAMQELERTNAFERAWLMVALPTGTGYVNYAAASTFELLTRGDCATLAMQYAARPSPLSLDRVAEGRHQARLLLDAIHARMETIPPAARPKLLLFGESLGAWTSQDAFMGHGTQGLIDLGVDHAIWIGTPALQQVEGAGAVRLGSGDRPRARRGLQHHRRMAGTPGGGARADPFRDDHPPRRRRGPVRP